MTEESLDPEIVRFGAFELDRRAAQLTRSGRRVHLAPQATRLLDLLVTRPGEVVTRDEICKALWGGETFLDFEAAVNACISQIRAALGDKATAPRFLETLPRRGYRFVAPVVLPHSSHETAQTIDQAPVSAREPHTVSLEVPPEPKNPEVRSWRLGNWIVPASFFIAIAALAWLAGHSREALRVAVLPIGAPAGDAELLALGELLQERTLIDVQDLAGQELVVIAKPAVEEARDSSRNATVLRAAAVDFFVDATLQHVESGLVRLHAKVARRSDMRILWGRDYEFPPAVFVEQREALAQEMAQRLVAASGGLHAAGQSRSADVADAILVAANLLRNDYHRDLVRAIEVLSNVCEREPDNSRARALLALASARIALQRDGVQPELWAMARTEALRALRKEPDNPDAIAALGAVHLFGAHDFKNAGRMLERAASHRRAPIEAHAWFGFWLSAMGAHARAIDEAAMVERDEPVGYVTAQLSMALYVAGRFDEAASAARRVLAIHPESRGALTWLWLTEVAHPTGQEVAVLERLVKVLGGSQSMVLLPESELRLDRLRQKYRQALEHEYQRGLVHTAFQNSVVAALMGDQPSARTWLKRAIEHRSPLSVLSRVHPVLAGLQSGQ